jgi:hypothetical protein
MRWAGRVSYLVERRVAYMILVGKPEAHRLIGKLEAEGKLILKSNL